MACGAHDAWALWRLGYPDQGLARLNEALTLAQQIGHPYSLGFALSFAAVFHQLCREVRCTQERSEAAIRLARNRAFPLEGAWFSPAWLGASATRTAKESIEQMHQGLTAHRVQGLRYYDHVFSHLSPRHMEPWDNQRKDSQRSQKR